MTFDELLDMLPHLRRRRQMNAATVRRLLNRKKGECTWCGGELTGRRTRWCSDDCVGEFNTRCCPTVAANLVWDRDKGLCQGCGRDIVKSQRVFYLSVYGVERVWFRDAEKQEPELASLLGYGRGRWGEVDHIVAVKDGGGLCLLDNLQLLCGQCHAGRTAEQAKTPVAAIASNW